jgi:ribosomal protein S18 acetylase RimI-like enzyme
MADFALRTDGIGGETRVGEALSENVSNLSYRGIKPSDLEMLDRLINAAMVHPWSPPEVVSAVEGPGRCAWFAMSGSAGAVGGAPNESSGLRDVALGFVLARRVLDVLEIDLVGVEPTKRRSGIARGLLLHLIEVERARGISQVQLELAASNTPAVGLYAGLGFVVVGRRSRYYPDGDDALLLTMVIE